MDKRIESGLFKRVDQEKIKKYFDENTKISKSQASIKALSNRNFINDVCRKGLARTALWNNVCDVLEVPRDYFDFIEPVKIVPEKKAEATDDILMSLLITQKKQEALLLQINDTLKSFL